jgi:hypothetical protein
VDPMYVLAMDRGLRILGLLVLILPSLTALGGDRGLVENRLGCSLVGRPTSTIGRGFCAPVFIGVVCTTSVVTICDRGVAPLQRRGSILG